MENTQAYHYKHLFETFKQRFMRFKEKPSEQDLEYYTDKIKAIEELSNESKRYYILFNHTTYFPAYMSDNVVKESGHSEGYWSKQDALLLFKSIHFKQIATYYNLNVWGAKAGSNFKSFESIKNASISFCGLKLKDKSGNWRTFFCNQKILMVDSKGKALLSFITAEEISYFHNSDVLWYRVASNDASLKWSRVYFSNGPKKEADDLFTLRELEILKLSSQQKSVLEISDILGISKNTVEKHRKNMIARSGLSNMTGVLRISQILNLV